MSHTAPECTALVGDPMPDDVAEAWDRIFTHYRLCEYGKRCAVAWIKSIAKLRGCKA